MKYDLIVIGGGPGGYIAAIRAAQLGMQVALVERDRLGGTCLNCGCIPTKTYYRQAALLRMIPHLDQFNIFIDSLSVAFDMAGAVARKNRLVDQMSEGIMGLLKSNGVEVVKGAAEIISPGLVSVRSGDDETSPLVETNKTDEEWDNLINAEELAIEQEKTLADGGPFVLEGERILIATGSESQRLALPGIDLSGVMDSTALLNHPTVPQKLVVIGGGVIGIEFASIYRSFGSSVTIVEAMDRILPLLDGELYKRLAALYKRQGIAIRTSASLKQIRRISEDELELDVETSTGPITIPADAVLVAVGRRAETKELGLEKIGVKTTSGGFIEVDQNYESSVPGIFAIGDVAGKGMLAHLAAEEGRAAVEKMNGLDSHVPYDAIPACIFSFPEVATVGLSTEQARTLDITLKTGKFLFVANGKAQTLGETDGFVKVLADQNDVIRGVHIIGPHASDLILEASLLVQKKMTVNEALQVVHPHPTLGEALYEALLDIQNRAVHIARRRP